MFKQFYNLVETDSTNLLKFPSSMQGKSISEKYSLILTAKGFVLQKSCHHTPQENGLAEHKTS